MELYNIFIGNNLDSSIKVINALSFEDLTKIDKQILINYAGITLHEGENIANVMKAEIKIFASTADDFSLIDKAINNIKSIKK